MLLLSCDAYSDLWDDFFNLKEKFWPDCPYQWHIVTESKDYSRNYVDVIKCGKELNWAGRYKKALQIVTTEYIGVYLDDYLIECKVDNKLIQNLVSEMYQNKIDYINMANDHRHIINLPQKQYYKDHLIIIPKNLKYGIDTAASLWNKRFLQDLLGEGDYSAWQFEMDRCKDAASKKGLPGLILCDDRQPFNATKVPFVIQGKIYTPCIKYFKNRGYKILSNRKRMGLKEVFLNKLKGIASQIKHGRKFLKWFATTFLGYKFFTPN